MSTEKKQLTQEELMVQGAAWSTAGNFISRLLGVLYIIPGTFGWGNTRFKPMLFSIWGIMFMLIFY